MIDRSYLEKFIETEEDSEKNEDQVLASKITFYTVHAEEEMPGIDTSIGGRRAPEESIE